MIPSPFDGDALEPNDNEPQNVAEGGEPGEESGGLSAPPRFESYGNQILEGLGLKEKKSRDADPVLSFQFSVELTEDPFGLLGFKIPIKGYFTEVSGLDVEWETAEYKSTNLLGLPHSNFVPLRPVYHPITLKRGITDSEGFWLWHQLLALGAKPLLKCYVMITMYNRSYEPIVQWSVERAWPSKISGPQIRSDSSDFVIEELTLTHGGIHRAYMNPLFMGIDLAMQMLLP